MENRHERTDTKTLDLIPLPEPPAPPSTGTTDSEPRHGSAATYGDVVDFEALLKRVENDTTLLAEMLELYQETSPRLLSEIESGVRAGDAQVVQHAAHSLKGALQNLSATSGADCRAQPGKNCPLRRFERFPESLAELKDELNRLQIALNDWSKEQCV